MYEDVKIWPWKPGDKGIAMLPLVRNIPFPKNDAWKMVTCKKCGAECWESDQARIAIKHGCTALCTACALRAGMK